PEGRRARARTLASAHRLVLLWSREAARAPALRAAAKLAVKGDKLTCVRLDAAHPPAALGLRAIALPRGRRALEAWRRLLARAAPERRAAIASSPRTSRLAGIGAALMMALAVGVALYVSDAA